MKLIIVESPTKTKSLSKYLGSDYEVLATMGHIRDLPKSKMGVEIKSKEKSKKDKGGFEFVPEYVENPDKIETIKKLQAAAKKAEVVLLASDPDREGEAIAWHVGEMLKASIKSKEKSKKDGEKIKRVTFHSITKEAILEAIKNPREIETNLVDAQQARRILDRIVGYQLSPVLWRKVRRGLSAGRVQSVATRMIAEREKEIEAFSAEEYWEAKAKVKSIKDKVGEEFWIDLIKMNGKSAEINNGEEANKIKGDLENGKYLVERIEKKERKVYPHPPFKTSTLQQAAANVLGWSAKKTMQVAQSLYEKGAITYHRTDSLNLVDSEVEKIRTYIANKYGVEALPEKPIVYKTGGKVVAQEAHEAIRPTTPTAEQLGGQAEDVNLDDQKLYQLIWRRTVSCQMVPAKVDQTNIYVKCDKYLFRATGETMKFASWKKLYKEADEVILPEVSEGEELVKKDLKLEQKFTLPPARFNDASLVKEMEKRGIGRPSTYAPTISTIIVRGYVERKQKKFYATPIGVTVTDFLVKNFPKELDYDFTAKMETGLDEIANGEKDWQEVLSEFYGPFSEDVAKSGEADRAKVPVESTGEKCPVCNEGEIVIRTGKFGKFLSCNRFPECKYTDKYVEYVEGVVCPKCAGRIIKKKTKTGRDFYGCENYPNCDFASWSKPVVAEKSLEGSEGV